MWHLGAWGQCVFPYPTQSNLGTWFEGNGMNSEVGHAGGEASGEQWVWAQSWSGSLRYRFRSHQFRGTVLRPRSTQTRPCLGGGSGLGLPLQKKVEGDFPGGAAVKNLPANAGDTGSIPGPGRSTSCGTTKPVRHNYWACALEPVRHNYRARAPRARALQQEKPLQWEACTPQRRVASARHN